MANEIFVSRNKIRTLFKDLLSSAEMTMPTFRNKLILAFQDQKEIMDKLRSCEHQSIDQLLDFIMSPNIIPLNDAKTFQKILKTAFFHNKRHEDAYKEAEEEIACLHSLCRTYPISSSDSPSDSPSNSPSYSQLGTFKLSVSAVPRVHKSCMVTGIFPTIPQTMETQGFPQ